jgi:hypothetical protein
MSDDNDTTANKLRIYQQNVMKTLISADHFTNSALHLDYDIIALQEPYIDKVSNARANSHWRVIYPTLKDTDKSRMRTVMFVNKSLDTNGWHQIDFPSNDVTAIELSGDFGTITILNIYNDCNNSDTTDHIRQFYTARSRPQTERRPDEHDLWLGDFNRHHPMWEDERNAHLCEGRGEREAQPLIELIADIDMDMTLPPRLHTLRHKANHAILTRPDNVFSSPFLTSNLESCRVEYGKIGPGADHYPISTVFNLPLVRPGPAAPYLNFKEVDWDEFREDLRTRRQRREYVPPKTTEDIDRVMAELDEDIQATIAAHVKPYNPTPYSKRWWTKELSALRKAANRSSRLAHKFRYVIDHPSHEAMKTAMTIYQETIEKTKIEHWDKFLRSQTLGNNDMWKALNYVTGLQSDGGRARIPTLKTLNADGTTTTH